MYISSPALFEHQVVHEDGHHSGDSSASLMQFEDMGPCKVALQLRCNIFSHNRATTPPAGPTEVREAVGRAVLARLTIGTLLLPTRRDIEECLLASRSTAAAARRPTRKTALRGSPP